MKLVFMGTPQFAVPSLQGVLQAGHTVLAVYTQPDRPTGRGMKLAPPPVKVLAESQGIPVFQPKSLKGPEEAERLSALAPDLILVVAYGRILPLNILTLPPYGCVNLHGSLLPKFRGAAPIQWCLINGESETGLCTQQMAQGIDTGDVLQRVVTPITPGENAGQLAERLSDLGAKLVLQTLEGLEKGVILPKPQDHSAATLAPIIKKELGALDFARSAVELSNLIRGLYGWPGTYCRFMEKTLKIHEAAPVSGSFGVPGTLHLCEGKLLVACGNGALELLTVQMEGKGKLTAAQFVQGYPIQGKVLENGAFER